MKRKRSPSPGASQSASKIARTAKSDLVSAVLPLRQRWGRPDLTKTALERLSCEQLSELQRADITEDELRSLFLANPDSPLRARLISVVTAVQMIIEFNNSRCHPSYKSGSDKGPIDQIIWDNCIDLAGRICESPDISDYIKNNLLRAGEAAALHLNHFSVLKDFRLAWGLDAKLSSYRVLVDAGICDFRESFVWYFIAPRHVSACLQKYSKIPQNAPEFLALAGEALRSLFKQLERLPLGSKSEPPIKLITKCEKALDEIYASALIAAAAPVLLEHVRERGVSHLIFASLFGDLSAQRRAQIDASSMPQAAGRASLARK